MKKVLVAMLVSLVAISSIFAAKPKRVTADKTDLTGYWSAADVQIVCDDIIEQIVSSDLVSMFEAEKGRAPFVTIGEIKNKSSESSATLKTDILKQKLRPSIVKSRVLKFVASDASTKAAMEKTILEQQDHAKEGDAKELDQRTAADWMLVGVVDTMVQEDKKNMTRAYYVTIELYDVETMELIDSFEPAEKNQPIKMFKKSK